EDGIRDRNVTGVQTCALPICLPFEQALRTREFEPDGPNWTPRISGLLSPDGSYKLSILKAADEAGTGCLRQTFEYPGQPGLGHLDRKSVVEGRGGRERGGGGL